MNTQDTTSVSNGAEKSMLPEYAVTFDDVSFTYASGEPDAVKNLTLRVKRGEFLSVLGHNGSGKSTLARLICGLLAADKGSVRVWGYNPADRQEVDEVRRHAGIVFQNPDNQMVASIVEDDVAFGPENLGVEREEIGRRIEWALRTVGMEKYRTSTPTRLSGGQKQRIAIAGVLAIKPDVIILDESTAMLDPRGRKEVVDVVKKLNKEEGMTVVLITHFMEEALLADRAVVMNRGELVAEGTPEQIFEMGDVLETFNLSLPEIGQIRKELMVSGIEIPPCLQPEVLAKELADFASSKGIKFNCPPYIPQRTPFKGQNEWDIDIRNLTFTYSKKSPFATHALNGVNLKIDEGEFFGIIGHTGSGKSTLVQHMNALIKLPQAEKKYKKPKVKKGEQPPVLPYLRVGRYDLSDKKCPWKQLRCDVGMVFQYPEYQLFAETVFDDVAFGLKNFRPDMPQEEVKLAVRESLEAVGLNYDDVAEKSPFDLSGGQKRRVAIAGVIVTKPKILILDEPAAGLDPLGKKEIMSLLHRLHGDWCRTVIIVSHDMDEVAENCTRACVVSEGKIFACDRPSELFRRGDELRALGLDVPLTAKICKCLADEGMEISCDLTAKGLCEAIVRSFGGDFNA